MQEHGDFSLILQMFPNLAGLKRDKRKVLHKIRALQFLAGWRNEHLHVTPLGDVAVAEKTSCTATGPLVLRLGPGDL